MVNTPQQPSEVICTHERRPGTTVCLHCRHAARVATQAKRKRLLLRGSAVGIVFATFIAAGLLGATAIRGKARRAGDKTTQVVTPVAEASAPAATPADSTAASPPPAVQQGDQPKKLVAPLMPVVPPGESPLVDGVTATRVDSMVMLSFDTPSNRTRIPEKFEQFVRSTLPAVYGHGVDSVLAKLPRGGIARQGNLLSQLPSSGVRIPISEAWMIRLYPETRQGQDGPLVVRYRVSVVPATE
ncbi:MAG: hypothetical protein JWM41_4234 [Gemmatimonadetes bacterium]|nr:hypothetical protein [Gemmatimonadota bacterium]